MEHDRSQDWRALAIALGATSLFFIAELAGAALTGSLALLADAVHMFTDMAALGMSLGALWFSTRPTTDTKTYGYYRLEILAALINGLVLWLAVVGILYEAYDRLQTPRAVHSLGMLIIGALGLAVNIFCAKLLAPHRHGSLNVRAAFLHVLSDMLGSLGAMGAAVVIMVTGWQQADALVSVVIAVLIFVNSLGLIREAVDILMEAVPAHIDLDGLRRELEQVGGTRAIHDLHVWTVTTGHYALSAHAVLDGSASDEAVLDCMQQLLASKFSIHHVTIQLEHRDRAAQEPAHF